VSELSARRKADRLAMCAQVSQLAGLHGITARGALCRGRRAVAVDLTGPHGLSLTVRFDGTSPGTDTFVLNWHGVDEGTRLRPGKFADVNPYHGRKATDVAHGFAELLAVLRTRFESIRDGSAFIVTEDVHLPEATP
jgi:hypothetical protein